MLKERRSTEKNYDLEQMAEVEIEAGGFLTKADIQADDEGFHIKPQADRRIGEPVAKIHIAQRGPDPSRIQAQNPSEPPINREADLGVQEEMGFIQKTVLR